MEFEWLLFKDNSCRMEFPFFFNKSFSFLKNLEDFNAAFFRLFLDLNRKKNLEEDGFKRVEGTADEEPPQSRDGSILKKNEEFFEEWFFFIKEEEGDDAKDDDLWAAVIFAMYNSLVPIGREFAWIEFPFKTTVDCIWVLMTSKGVAIII